MVSESDPAHLTGFYNPFWASQHEIIWSYKIIIIFNYTKMMQFKNSADCMIQGSQRGSVIKVQTKNCSTDLNVHWIFNGNNGEQWQMLLEN